MYFHLGKQYLPSFLINAEFNSPYVAVGIKVTAAGENWRFGGHLAQEFSFPGSGYRNSGKAFFRTEELIINNVSIIEIPVITGSPYKLRFFPPTWFRDLQLEIWEYSAEAANQFLRWNKVGTKVVQGLVNRRRAEKELFES